MFAIIVAEDNVADITGVYFCDGFNAACRLAYEKWNESNYVFMYRNIGTNVVPYFVLLDDICSGLSFVTDEFHLYAIYNKLKNK